MEKIYNANRFTPVASAPEFSKENMNIVFEFFKDYIASSNVEHVAGIQASDGKITELYGVKVAASRYEENQLYVVTTV